MISARVEGGEQLIRKLESLERKIAGKLLRTALRNGAKIYAGAASAKYPRRTGRTATKITVRAGKRSRKGPRYQVIFKGAEELVTVSKKGVRHFPPAVIEYGTATREAIAPMRQAFDEATGRAQQSVADELKSGIAAAARER